MPYGNTALILLLDCPPIHCGSRIKNTIFTYCNNKKTCYAFQIGS